MAFDPYAPVRVGSAIVNDEKADFFLTIIGNHVLLYGASGAGKGSVVWSCVLGLMPGVRSGLVQIHGIDLKGGVEFGLGLGAFADVAFTVEEAAELIERLWATTEARLRNMREQGSRKHVPTVEEPAHVLFIDEASALVLASDKSEWARIEKPMKLWLTQSRAAAGGTFAALQDPRKEMFPLRDNFLQTIALRLRSESDVRLALGEDAIKRGINAHAIPRDKQGMGYSIATEGPMAGEPIRFRAMWVSDDQVRTGTVR